MSTYHYSGYEQERQRRKAEWEAAPKACPHCDAPINQQFSAYGTDKPRKHCGSDKCRKAASRAGIAERKRREREKATSRIDEYAAQLPADQHKAVVEAKHVVMQADYDQGHTIMRQVIEVIEAQRCKHDRIAQLEENAAI